MLDVVARQPRPAPPPPPKRRFRLRLGRWVWIALAAVLLIAAIVTSLLLWHPWARDQSDAAVSKRITTQVAKIYLVPTGEEPVVARIQDVSKLSNQAFYKDARNGDYLVLYNNAKLALIYRSEQHKIINAAPISNPQ